MFAKDRIRQENILQAHGRKHGRVWKALKPSLTKATAPNVIAGGAYAVFYAGVMVTVSPDIHILFNPSCFKSTYARKMHSDVVMAPWISWVFLLGLENEREITEAEFFTFLILL